MKCRLRGKPGPINSSSGGAKDDETAEINFGNPGIGVTPAQQAQKQKLSKLWAIYNRRGEMQLGNPKNCCDSAATRSPIGVSFP